MSSSALSENDSPPSSSASEHQLLRALGPGIAIAVVVGNTIGTGIFAKPSQIAIDANGSFPLIISGWILGGIICLFGALCFAELSAMLPRAGGLYVFLREAYGKPVAFLFGLNEYVFGRTATNAAMSVFFATLCCAPFLEPQQSANPWVLAGLACVALLGITMINVFGVIWGGRVQGLTTLIKAGFLGLIAVLPFIFTFLGHGAVQWSNYSTTYTPPADSAVLTTVSAQFAAILLAVMWAYNGWHDIAPVAEEVRDPQRNIPLALIGGTFILIVLYVGANLAYHGVLTMQEIAEAQGRTAQLTIQKTLQPVFGIQWAKLGADGITLVTMCSVFGALNSNLMLGPRIPFAMARDGIFWKPLAHVHAHYRTPAVSIISQACIACVLLVVGTWMIVNLERFQGKNLFELFTNFVVYSANIFYALCVLAVFVLRVRHPEWERPYRVWGYPFTPAIYLIVMGWFLWVTFISQPLENSVAIGLVLFGIPVYLCIWLRNRKRPLFI